mmetsp:Transcript_39540/g.130870  ORF Transcript_39540/g.130870 Transcript_39540/m.130870 type:complete len:219 (+) Transcript_39540:354-1010(+)
MPPTGSASPPCPTHEPSRRPSAPLRAKEGRRGQDGGHRGAAAAGIRGGWHGGARVRRADQMGPHVVRGRGPADAGVDCADVLRGGGLHGTMEGGALAARLPVVPAPAGRGCGGRGGGEGRGSNAASVTRTCWSGPGRGRPRRSGAGRPHPIPTVGGNGGGGDGGCAARDGGRRPEDGGPGGQAAGDTSDAPLANGGDPPRVARDGALPHASRLSWVRR